MSRFRCTEDYVKPSTFKINDHGICRSDQWAKILTGCSEKLPVPGGSESLRSAQARPLLVRALLRFGCARFRPGLLRLSLLGSHVTQRGRLVLLGFAFLLQRLVPAHGPDRFLGSALHVFHDAFDACLRSRLIRQNRLPCSSANVTLMLRRYHTVALGASVRRRGLATSREMVYEMTTLG